MRRSGAPSQRTFSGLLNLPSPKTPIGGGGLRAPDAKTSIDAGTHGLSSYAGAATSEETNSVSSCTKESGQGAISSLQLFSPYTCPGLPQNPTFQKRSPLLHLNHSSEVQSHPSSPKPMTFIPTNQYPVMQPNIHSKGQNHQEFTKSLQTNQTPAAAVDTTNNPSFRCFCNLSMLSDILLEGTLRVFGARNLRASTRNGKEMVCCV